MPNRKQLRYVWTAEDYERVERLDRLGLPPHRIGRLLDPPATADAIRNACTRAGIELMSAHAGRPSNAQIAHWRQIETRVTT